MNTQPQMELIDPPEVSRILKITVETLAQWRHHKRYPLPYVKIGRSVRYDREAVQKFIDDRTQSGQVPADA